MKRMLRKRLVLAGIAVLVVVTAVTAVLYPRSGPPGATSAHSVSAAGCSTKVVKVPGQFTGVLFRMNGLPTKVHRNASPAGVYEHSSNVASISKKTMTALPASATNASGRTVYADRSATCNRIYVSIAHGPYQLAVYEER